MKEFKFLNFHKIKHEKKISDHQKVKNHPIDISFFHFNLYSFFLIFYFFFSSSNTRLKETLILISALVFRDSVCGIFLKLWRK